MHKLLIFILVIILFSCNSSDSNKKVTRTDQVLEQIAGKDYAKLIELPTTQDGQIDTNLMARIVFDELEFNFDTIFENDIISHEFSFVNKGVKDLYLLQTHSSCGCTIPSYTKEPILPNGTGEISIKFNSKGKKGKQFRKVSIMTNSYPNESILVLKGFVK